MKKEFKIGLIIGVVIIAIVVIVFATKKSNSVEDRAMEAVTEPNLPALDVNAPSLMFDMNSTSALPTSTDANTSTDYSAAPSLPSTQSSDSTVFEQSQPVKTQKFHVVKRGDTLSSISKKYYNSVKYIDKIYQANTDVIKNKNVLKPGVKLVIPE
ncbi:MAG: hypothetical protein A2178_00860 [Planctomycetes bacterium GWC2_49_10]|nr:MAG: hypothetical protein A2178_00860 [Planctomycetes bacterium GWC2_49_10]